MSGWLEVALVAGLASGVAGLAGLAVLRRVVRVSLGAAAVVVPAVAVLAVVAGVVATAQLMFLSRHDLLVVLIVCAVAGAIGVLVGAVLARRVRSVEDEVARLAEERARAEGVEQTRRELVAWVSHDLRTPLAGIRALAEALEDGVGPSPDRYHRQLREQVERLSGMVDDLFELSRLQAGSLMLTRTQVPLQQVVGDVLAGSEPLATARGVHLDSAVGEVPVEADPRELGRALANLVTNAIRHTPSDGTVTVAGASHPEGGVVLSVTDMCGGIPDDQLPRVFDVGWRADESRTPDRDHGAGIGLAIVRGIVAAHGGSVTAANVPGGCRFVVRIPA